MKTLHLTLKKVPFDIMINGIKTKEFRKKSKWIESRLYDKNKKKKNYELIKFINGYGGNKPFFICKYNGFDIALSDEQIKYSNGLTVDLYKDDYIINLGDIIETGNLRL